ncbi:hypothetical protein AB0G15_32815 [Streptosporangium sp. NPDC023825]|uniref:hypothetical protein n=1 Tax=Streptosporangium sp. NPDC023825 TaxID=3154909 RepID=UPI0034451F7A
MPNSCSAKNPVTGRGRVAAGAALTVLAGACGTANPPVPAPSVLAACDDSVHPARDLPRALRDDGITQAVGASDIWFVAPDEPAWGASAQSLGAGKGFYLKRPLWTSSAKLPTLTVTAIGSQATGKASLTPTSEGLPGPLPMGIEFSSRGCWKITATAEKGQAEITVKI